MSQPEFTGEQAYRRVNDTFVFEDKSIFEITYRDESDRSERLLATPNHPFWVNGVGWTGAEHLKSGQTLQLRDGRGAQVESIRDTSRRQRVYNFEVDGFHTYYVGTFGIWVHNTNCGQLFVNQQPELLNEELATAKSLGVSPLSPSSSGFDTLIGDGPVKYVVDSSGNVLVGPYSVNGVEISHAVLSGGQPVLAAGVADIAGSAETGYFGASLDTQSGHFMFGTTAAQNAAANQAAIAAFAKYGIGF